MSGFVGAQHEFHERRDPASGTVRTSARGRPSSAGRCRQSSRNGPAVHVDRGSADNGHYRRPLGRQRAFLLIGGFTLLLCISVALIIRRVETAVS
jgi:hypothetical protein